MNMMLMEKILYTATSYPYLHLQLPSLLHLSLFRERQTVETNAGVQSVPCSGHAHPQCYAVGLFLIHSIIIAMTRSPSQ